MPNTTNFNWPTPADTDLVKDGAAAIRNLGNGIDTSLIDLKGGTTGQILSKASNADMDFTFITPNVGDITEVQAGTGISVASGTGPIPVVTNSMATEITAKGDLIVGTGSGTFDNLPVGTNGYTLVADSVETTGLKWVAPSTPALVGVSLKKDGATTSLTSGVIEYLTYTTEEWDTNTFHDNSTNTTRITIPSGYGGKYLFSGFIGIGAVGSNSFDILMRKNGASNPVPGGRLFLEPNNAGNTAAGGWSVVLNLVATDYIEIGLRIANTSASYSVDSLFQATYLGA